ncbi:FAD-dependent oxidoreductase [Saccharomonospora sp. NPDC046836]|uniref:NAD(P)/FAD-dependent oxidoreductase n=1 Tax=Saccharomonospora sp. NPDC046836 TaxID=3156921 RepID=UPI0033EC96BD
MLNSVVVVGGGAAGVAAAESLRREGYDGSLLLVGEEPLLPYDRPPLSKQVLAGEWEHDRTTLRERGHYDEKDIRLHHGRARDLDLAERVVRLDDGSALAFDGLVIATGVRPRRLPEWHRLEGVHVLRGHADVLALRAAFLAGGKVVIVGAGFLGMEVAASARGMGLDVTVVDPLAQPMLRQVGIEVAAAIARLHRDHGVDLRTGVDVAGMRSESGRVNAVALSDGTVVPADCVLVSIGAEPAVDWLRTSGLALDDGVECDEYCQAAPGVYAAGDVASWLNPRYRRRMRLEHRLNATEQGGSAARNLLHGNVTPFSPLPYFWTDQYSVKIQVHGVIPDGAEVSAEEGSFGDDRFVALYRKDDEPTAVLGWNAPARILPYRKLLLTPTDDSTRRP